MRRLFSFRYRGVLMGGLVGAALLTAAPAARAQLGSMSTSGLSSGGLSTGGLSSSGLGGGISSGGLGGASRGGGGGIGSSGGLGGGLGSSGGLGGGLGSSGGLGGGLGSSGGLGGGLGSGTGGFGGGLGGVGGSTGYGSGRGGAFGGSPFGGGFTGGGTGTTFPGVAPSNPLQQYFSNPLSYAFGTQNGAGKGTFGVPINNIATANTLGMLGQANINANRPVGATSIGIPRTSFYTTTLDPSLVRTAPMPPARLQADLQNVLARSTRLPSAANVQVTVEGDVVTLRGTVSSEKERRMTEASIRLTPGVHDVRNELEVRGAATASAGR